MYKYNKTLMNGAEKYIDGLKNIEMFLDDNDNWNFHDSSIHSFYWDDDKRMFTVTVEPNGYGTIEGETEDNHPLLDFHFKDVIGLNFDFDPNCYIMELEISKVRNYLECWFNGYGIRINCTSIVVDRPRFVPNKNGHQK